MRVLVVRSSLVLLSALVMGGCYQYVPIATPAEPPVGERVAFEITDRGRAELSERLGAGVVQVEGSLTTADSARYVMRIWGLSHIGGQKVHWSGETVSIARDYVGTVKTRQLSKGRTWLAVGAAAGAFYLLIAQDLVGGGFGRDDDDPPDPPQSSIIWSWK